MNPELLKRLEEQLPFFEQLSHFMIDLWHESAVDVRKQFVYRFFLCSLLYYM